jgi:tetratricopeptide (TPR) repeat protein
VDTEPRLAELLHRWQQLRQQGSPASLDVLCADCPELREAVAQGIRSLVSPQPSLAPTTDVVNRPVKPPSDPTLPSEAGRFQVLGEIARGGMGVVLRARDPEIGREVALKIVLPEHQHNPTVLLCFLGEARLAGQLEHPGIAPVYDLGQLPDGRPFFVMKLIEGRTLAALLKERSNPNQDLPHFLRYFEAVCQTIGYAHARGVIHRDLKPSNVMVGTFGEVQVMDWGLAKVLARGADVPGGPRTAWEGIESREGTATGTPGYMPPEQAMGKTDQIDARSDVFGLGGMLCEILTGQPPFVGPEQRDVLIQTVRGDLSDAFARLDRCEADRALVRLAKACLMPARQERPADGGAVARAMSAYLAGVQQRLRLAELGQARAEARAEGERKSRRLAVGAYRQAIKLRPNDANAYYNLAHALRKQKKLDEAVAALRQAIKLRPDFAKAHNNLGNALRKQKEYDEAVAAYRRAIEIRPDYALAHNNLGTVLYAQMKLDEAVAAFRAAIEITPNLAEAHNNLGNALRKQKHLDEAIAAYRQAIKLQPKFAEPHLNLGLAQIHQGRFKEALAALTKGRQLLSPRDHRGQSVQQLIASCQRDLSMEARLAAVLDGKDRPAGPSEQMQFARLCMLKKLYLAAARFSLDAFTAEPKIAEAVPTGARYHAACCAVLAGCGKGTDGGKLDADERSRWRQQALVWLRAELTWWTRMLDGAKAQQRAAILRVMERWQSERDLAGVRGSDALGNLPQEDRAGWWKLWAEVAALRERAKI